jgi:hypothetical protein
LTRSRLHTFRVIEGFLDEESTKTISQRVAGLTELGGCLVSEVDGDCKYLIIPPDGKLFSAGSDAATKVFYGYSGECKVGADEDEDAAKAKACSESALAIPTAELGKAGSAYLGVVLNDSVFLYGRRRADSADKSLHEMKDFLDGLEDSEYSDSVFMPMEILIFR